MVRANIWRARGRQTERQCRHRSERAVARRRGARFCSPDAGRRRWPLASPPRRSCSARSSSQATTASSKRVASPAAPTSPIVWAHDESETAVTLEVLIDGQWRTPAVGGAAPNGLVYDREAGPSPGWSAAPISGRPWSPPASRGGEKFRAWMSTKSAVRAPGRSRPWGAASLERTGPTCWTWVSGQTIIAAGPVGD